MKKNFFYAGGLSLLLWGMAACSGQGKADKAAIVADSVVVKTDSVAADCPKALKSNFSLFCFIIISPSYILLFLFSLRYDYTEHSID